MSGGSLLFRCYQSASVDRLPRWHPRALSSTVCPNIKKYESSSVDSPVSGKSDLQGSDLAYSYLIRDHQKGCYICDSNLHGRN
jgi:hypothetical protein